MEREVRYCTTEDGVRIAYCVQGEGPVLVVCPLFIEAFSLDDLFLELADFIAALGDGRRLVRYDKRGTGLSQRDVTDLSQAAQVRDLGAVVNAVGEARVAVWAPSLSGSAALEYAATNPGRVARLVLWGTFARGRDVMTRQAVDGIVQLCRSNWLLGSQLTADLSGRNEFAGLTSKIAATYRDSVTGDIAAETIMTAWETYDASNFLSAIRCPTLILHRRGDPTFPFALGQQLAEQIPNARMVPFEGTASHPVLGDRTAVARVSNAFLNEDPETRSRQPGVDARETQGAFRTVLFTDIVGHTEMMSRLGDEKGRTCSASTSASRARC